MIPLLLFPIALGAQAAACAAAAAALAPLVVVRAVVEAPKIDPVVRREEGNAN